MTDLVTHAWWAAALVNAARAVALAMLTCAVVWLAERRWPAGPDPGWRGRAHNLCVFALLLLSLIPLDWLLRAVHPWWPSLALVDHVMPGWQQRGAAGAVLATLLYAVVWDFLQYWTHRIEHRVGWLWRMHQVHHADAHMNASTSLRRSMGSAWLGFFLTSVPMLLICGPHWVPYAGSIVLFSLWGYLNHANIRLPFGPLTPLVSGPQWHRLHHGRSAEYHDCNFAAFFPVWDILFGTWRRPRPGEWIEVGLADDTTPRSAVAQVYWPWGHEVRDN